MLNRLQWGIGALVLAGLGAGIALVFVRTSSAQTLTRPPIKIGEAVKPQISKVGTPFSYVKKRLAITVVDFDPFKDSLPSGSPMGGFQASGFACVTLTPEDTPRFSAEVEPVFTLYSMYSPEPYQPSQAGTVVFRGPGMFYEYKSSVKPWLNGSRISATYNEGAQLAVFDLVQTYDQIFAGTPWPQMQQHLKGPRAGVFVLHVDVFDHSRKIWYYGDVAFRLYVSYYMASGESFLSGLQKLANRLKGG